MNAMLQTLLTTVSAVSLLTAVPATAQFPYAEHRQNDRAQDQPADRSASGSRPDQADPRPGDSRAQNQGRPPGSPDPRPNLSQGGQSQQPGYTQPVSNYPQPTGGQPGYQNQQPGYGQGQQPGYGQNQPGYGQNRPGYGNGNQPGYGQSRPDYDRNRPDRDRDYDRNRPGYGNQAGYGRPQPGYGYNRPRRYDYGQPGYGGYVYRPGYGPGYGRNGAFDYDRYQREWEINRLDAIVGLYPGQAYELRRVDAYFDREFAYAPRNPEVYQRLQYEKMQAVLAILTPLQRDRLFAQDYYRQYSTWNRGNYGPGYGNRGYVAPSYGGDGNYSQGY
jgi:hypothetical protein